MVRCCSHLRRLRQNLSFLSIIKLALTVGFAVEGFAVGCLLGDFEGALDGALVGVKLHTRVLNFPEGSQVATPPPLYPSLQRTATFWPVVPTMDPAAEKPELATCVAVQGFAMQVIFVKTCVCTPHITTPLPEYPLLQPMVIKSP